ncbi:MAG: acetamidase [Gemmatimonadetes bacterium]|nr:acetamidase [Gemmatimonadota bacterium]
MNSRRQFLVRAPLGLAGVLAACKKGEARGLSADASGAGAAPAGTAMPQQAATPLAAIPANAPTLNYIPKHEELSYTFGGAAPRQRIKPGTRIVTWTEDCFDGVVKTAADLPSKKMAPGHDNPQTGPFYVEGAEPGDTVAIHILKLEPARSYAVSSFGPGFGALVGNNETAMLGPDFPETTWRYDVDTKRNVARSSTRNGSHSWEVPLAPFLGCLGVAPAGGEVRTTIVPGNFGGNMDCPEVRAGNTVYLGVNVPGALLSFGDGHYAMGEGEIMGAAIEGAMNVEVYVELIKKLATPVPRIENASQVMFVGSGRPLEDAARVAFKSMVNWSRARTKLSEMDAYQFVAQNTKASIIQLVDPEYTVLVSMEKRRLPVSGAGH